MKGSVYTLCYAGILGAVCALLLTANASFTAPYRAANARAEEILNILTALRVPLESDTSAKQLVEIFNINVREETLGQQIVYVYSSGQAKGQTKAVAVQFSGQGLWGPIKGILALEPDMQTIWGITFYEQEETPGLGGEITSAWFREQFAGKSIMDESGKAGIVIGSTDTKSARNQVDAITGATMTCDRVQAMLNTVIREIVSGKGRND